VGKKASKPEKTGVEKEVSKASKSAGKAAARASDVSRQTLELTPERVLKFLSATGNSLSIRSILASYGYTTNDQEEGWALLQAASGFSAKKESRTEQIDVETRAAVVEVDRWDEKGFALAHASLARRHPAQDAFVFDNLRASTGPAAVIGVKLFLDRLDALESGADRKATRKDDHAALATLAARGITTEERARLRALVQRAQTVSALPETISAPAADTSDDKVEAALGALRDWYDEWSGVAKAVITRRDYLIRLGLAKRKKGEKSSDSAQLAGIDCEPRGGLASAPRPCKPIGSLASRPEGLQDGPEAFVSAPEGLQEDPQACRTGRHGPFAAQKGSKLARQGSSSVRQGTKAAQKGIRSV
jgi:hypothetical protein